MNARLKYLSVFVFLFVGGCAYDMAPERYRLEGTARYDQLARQQEGKIQRQPEPSAAALYDLCYAYSKLKDYKKLFACLDQLQGRIKAGDKQVVLFSSINASDGSPTPHLLRSEAYIEWGDYAQAIAEATIAYALAGKVSNSFWGFEKTAHTINALGLLGLAHALNGDSGKSRDFLSQLLAVRLDQFGIAQTRPLKNNAVARVYMALGMYGQALENLHDSHQGLRDLANVLVGASAKGANVFATLEIPNAYILNKCLLETGRNQEARAGFDTLLRIPEVRNVGALYWMILFDRGRIAEREGRVQEAIGYFRQAVEVIEQQRSTINTEASRIGFVGDKQMVYQQLIAALFASQQYAQAFEYVERAKSRALVDMLAAKQDFSIAAGNAAQVRSLLSMAASAESMALIQGSSAEPAQARTLLASARKQLQEQSPELASLTGVSSLSALEVQALLPEDEALVEYYYQAPDLLAFVLTRRSVHALRLPGADLTLDIQAFRRQLEAVDTTAHRELGRRLHERLILPVLALSDSQKLLVVAHGPLHYLPFNALHDGRRYLLETHSLRLLPSASVLKYLKAQAVAKPGEILAFGNPDLGDPRLDLAYAQAEAVAVTQGRQQAKVLLRKDASESALRQYGQGFRYLHFATHGRFDAESPLKSALYLAKDSQNDGQLTVDKLYSLRLDADLVTLSACETGLGKVASGDDVVGLTRAFLYAGSRSVVASLWPVDDQATAFLMGHFYDNLKHGDKRAALRQAQLTTLKKYPHPFYWAAFQLVGSAN